MNVYFELLVISSLTVCLFWVFFAARKLEKKIETCRDGFQELCDHLDARLAGDKPSEWIASLDALLGEKPLLGDKPEKFKGNEIIEMEIGSDKNRN